MITPTPFAVALMLGGVPIFIGVAVLAPGLWPLSAVWLFGILGGTLLDAIFGARLSVLSVDLDAPVATGVGGETELGLNVSFETGPLPERFEAQLGLGERFSPVPLTRVEGFEGRTRRVRFSTTALRRGTGEVVEAWLRWNGPFGLVQKIRRQPLDREIVITPNLAWVSQEAIRLHDRHADFGEKVELEAGAGSEFDALREFSAGMDRRAIDWKQSARHRTLLAKEFRTERNHTIVLAFDTGRLMCEPLKTGSGTLSRLDRAIHAGLLLAHVSLKAGDHVAFYGFDAKPRLPARPVSGARGLPQLQAAAAKLEYSENETNYTLGLAELATQLNRRALVILFTDFVDTVSAEIMNDNLHRLSKRHQVLFTTFTDPLLGELTARAPLAPEDVSRAVISGGLLSEREIVFARLARMGVDVLEADADQFGSRLVNRYLEIKRRNAL